MNTIYIGKIAQDFDLPEFPQVSQEFIYNYGLKQILNDCHSSVQAKDFASQEEFAAAVQERVISKLEALGSGAITTRSASGKVQLSPEDKLMNRDAKAAIDKALKAKGVKKGNLPEGKYEEFVQAYIAKHEETLRKAAKAEIKRLGSMETVDISELLG